MVQNLDLDLSTSRALTNQNTDLISKTSWTPDISTSTTNTTWSSDGTGKSFDPGNKYWSPASGAVVNTQGTLPSYRHIGNFYNQIAASAGSISTSSASSADMTDSICPKGWTIPQGPRSYNATKSFENLVKTTYGLTVTTQIYSEPLAFSGAGTVYGTDGYIAQVNAYLWSKRKVKMILFSYGDNNILYSTSSFSLDQQGGTVRCVAQ